MKKALPKREPKKEQGGVRTASAFILLVLLVAGSFSLQVFSATQILESNRLLSTFQRIDTVKDECAAGFVLLDDKCYETIGKLRQIQRGTDRCQQPICHVLPDVGRSFDDDGEGIE